MAYPLQTESSPSNRRSPARACVHQMLAVMSLDAQLGDLRRWLLEAWDEVRPYLATPKLAVRFGLQNRMALTRDLSTPFPLPTASAWSFLICHFIATRDSIGGGACCARGATWMESKSPNRELCAHAGRGKVTTRLHLLCDVALATVRTFARLATNGSYN